MKESYSLLEISRIFGKTPEAVRQWRRGKGRNGVKLDVVLRDEGIRVTADQLKEFLRYNSDLFLSSDVSSEAKELERELNAQPPLNAKSPTPSAEYSADVMNYKGMNTSIQQHSTSLESRELLERFLAEKRAQMSRLVTEMNILNHEIEEYQKKLEECN